MLSWILVAGSLALGLLGFVDVYRATVNGGGAGTMNFAGALLGIGEIAAAAVIAILARIVQARSQHEELLAALEERHRDQLGGLQLLADAVALQGVHRRHDAVGQQERDHAIADANA